MKTKSDKTMKEMNVVIPLYNEESVIDKVLVKWSKCFDALSIDYQISLYNDGSNDNSLNIAKKCASDCPRIKVIDKANSGHGPTILQGYLESKSEWIFQIDSDDEVDPENFRQFWENKDNYDFVIGFRHQRTSPIQRKLITAVSRLTIKIFYGSGITDVNCPFRLMRRIVFAEYFKLIPSDTFAPNVILSGISLARDFRILEIPISYKLRETGTISIRSFRLFKAAVTSFLQTVKFAHIIKKSS